MDSRGRSLPGKRGPLALGLALLACLALRAGEIGTNDFRISQQGAEEEQNPSAKDGEIAYNSADNEFLVVWSGTLAAGETEIFAQRLDAATGAELGDDFRISDAGPEGDRHFDARDPAVAYNRSRGEHLVVWLANEDTTGEVEVFGQRIDAATGVEVGENDFRVSDMGPDGDVEYGPTLEDEAAVTYNPDRDEYLVVWTSNDDTLDIGESEVFAQILAGGTGAEVGRNDFRVSDMGAEGEPRHHARNPSAVYNSTAGEYLVVWSGWDVGQGVFGQRLDGATGAQLGENDLSIAKAVEFDAETAVAYSPVDDEYLVVWATFKSAEDVRRIAGQRLDASGVQVGENDFVIADTGAFPVGPAVAWNGAHQEYLVVWTDFLTMGRRIASGGEFRGEEFQIGDATGSFSFDPAVAYGGAGDEYLVVWDDERLAATGRELFGQRLLGAEGIGGSASGIRLRRAECHNLATGQTVTPPIGTGTSWACEAAGLVVNAGDPVSQTVSGSAGLADESVGGTVCGVGELEITCFNRTTGQSVIFSNGDARAWDCEAAGLAVVPGDRIVQIASGTAD